MQVNIWQPQGSTDLYIDNAKIDMSLGAQPVLNGYAYQIDKVPAWTCVSACVINNVIV